MKTFFVCFELRENQQSCSTMYIEPRLHFTKKTLCHKRNLLKKHFFTKKTLSPGCYLYIWIPRCSRPNRSRPAGQPNRRRPTVAQSGSAHARPRLHQLPDLPAAWRFNKHFSLQQYLNLTTGNNVSFVNVVWWKKNVKKLSFVPSVSCKQCFHP